jgi:hypothetical protein
MVGGILAPGGNLSYAGHSEMCIAKRREFQRNEGERRRADRLASVLFNNKLRSCLLGAGPEGSGPEK